MSYDLTNFTSHVEDSNDILTATLFSGGDTGKFARFETGVKGKRKVPTIEGDVILQNGTCKDANGTTVIGEVFIEVQDWTYHESFCVADLEDKLPNSVLAPGSNATSIPKPWESKMVDVKVAAMQKKLELTYWQGDTEGTYSNFDGFIKKIDALGTAIDGNIKNYAANQVEAKATGTITLSSSVAGDYVVLNGLTYTGVNGAKSDNTEYSVDTGDTEAALDLADSISSDSRHGVSGYLTALSTLGVVTVTSNLTGIEGNKVTMTTPDATITLSGATLSGGINASIGINKDNVITIVDDIISVASVDVKEDETFEVFCGNDVFDVYIGAVKAANNYHESADNDGQTYKIGGSGKILRKVRGLNGTDRLFATVGRNFVVGMDKNKEDAAIHIFYVEDTDTVHFRTKAKSGVTVFNAAEIVEFTLVA